MKKILLGITAVLLIVLAGSYIYISTIDWNLHKDKIAEQFSIVTGKRVVFDGPITFRLLPSPYLSASDVKVYSEKGRYRTEPLANIEKLVASLDLLPLLFGGNFVVERMSIINPKAIFEIMDDGTINWQSEKDLEAEFQVSKIDVRLNSVTIQGATVNFVYNKRNIDFSVGNLNAEVIAESIFGPYRIDGSYVKNNNPGGFAVSLGQFSDTFGTTVNLTLMQPVYETTFVFDGVVLFKNDSVNGSLTFESNKLADFVNSNFNGYKMSEECDKPLAVSMKINTSASKIDLSNLVVKYGSTVGAGNVMIPIPDKSGYGKEDELNGRKKVEFGFNMTEFDINPVAKMIEGAIGFWEKEKSIFSTDMGFDLAADIHAVKAEYNGQIARELNLSMDILQDEVKIHDFNAVFPGETKWKSKGNVFPMNGALTYNVENSFASSNVAKLFEWFDIKLPNEGEFTYKKASSVFGIEGTLNNIKMSPFSLNIDKSAINGEIGIVRGERMNYVFMLNVDSVNFDNYVLPLSKEEQQKDFAERMAFRFSKLAFLNNFDARGNIKLGLGIYENIPFENSELEFTLKDGSLNIENSKFNNIASSTAEFKGVLKGFGVEPKFENLKYSFEGKDIVSVINKFNITPPDINIRDLKVFSIKGIATGTLERLALKAVNKIGSIDNVFSGEAVLREGFWFFNGDLELRAPDFVKFLNDMNYKYSPKVFTLGLFTLKTKFVGNSNKFQATDLNANIGSNNFQGGIIFDTLNERSKIVANITANKFEIDRFFYVPTASRETNKTSFKPTVMEKSEFLSRPFFAKDKINYSFYSEFDLKGKINTGRLSYKDSVFNDVGFDLNLVNSELEITNFKGNLGGGKTSGNLKLSMGGDPVLGGQIKIENQNIREASWRGNVYGLFKGVLSADADFSTNANSFDEMFSNLNATIKFKIANPVVKGWDIAMIHEDVVERNKSEGFVALVYEALQKNETAFDEFFGNVKIVRGDFSLDNSWFKKEKVSVKAEATGNLANWDMDARFWVSFLDLEKVPELLFSFAGPIASPKLSVDASLIVDIYDSHWKKIEEDKKAKELSRLESLNNLMEAEQRKAFDLRTRMKDEIRPKFEEKALNAESNEVIGLYGLIEKDLDKIDLEIEGIFAQALVKNFDEKFIEKLAKKNADLYVEFNNVIQKMNDAYFQDVKFRINKDYNEISRRYNTSRTKMAEFRDRLADYTQRLISIGSGFSIETDEKINLLKAEIEKAALSIDSISSNVRKDYSGIQDIVDLGELERRSVAFRTMLNEAEEGIYILESKIVEIYDYLNLIISKEEREYQERKKNEEIQRKLEENTGKISVTGSGKDIMVVRDIEDIQKSEEAASKEEVRVLDFSKSSVTAKGKTKNAVVESSEKKIEKTGGFIREISDEPIAAGGVIIKQ